MRSKVVLRSVVSSFHLRARDAVAHDEGETRNRACIGVNERVKTASRAAGCGAVPTKTIKGAKLLLSSPCSSSSSISSSQVFLLSLSCPGFLPPPPLAPRAIALRPSNPSRPFPPLSLRPELESNFPHHIPQKLLRGARRGRKQRSLATRRNIFIFSLVHRVKQFRNILPATRAGLSSPDPSLPLPVIRLPDHPR